MYALGLVVLLFGVVSCDLSVEKTKECGQITCDYHYYCSIIDNSCKHCRKICDPGHNQDAHQCDRQCQDYIHDTRYLRKDEVVDNSQEQLDKVQVLSTISLIFSLIALICLVLAIVMLWLNNKTSIKKFNVKAKVVNKKEKPEITRKDDRVQANSNEVSTIRLQNDAVLNMQDITDIIHSKTMPPQDDYMNLTTFKNHHAKSEPDSASSVYTNKTNKTAQPLAKRLPSEDSTLDFIYDNPALAPSPVLDKEKGTSSGDSRKVSDSDT